MNFRSGYIRIDSNEVPNDKFRKMYKILGWFFMLLFISLLFGSSQVHDYNVRCVLIVLVLMSMGFCSCFCALGYRKIVENEIV